MAKIIKISSPSSTSKIANQFKTSRNSTTNPFKYQNFEGNTLDISAFADVFESSTVKDTNKLKMIAASVAGSMHKFKSSITEPVINFVNHVRESVSSAWTYAKNTNISEIGIIKNVSDFMNKPISIPGSAAVDNTINGIKSRIGVINENITDWSKEIQAGWTDLISKIYSGKKISSDLTVAELENLWKEEIAKNSVEEAA